MRHTKEPARWTPFEWIVTLLLTTCAAMLGACTALIWFYLPTFDREVNSSTHKSSLVTSGRSLSASPLRADMRQHRQSMSALCH